MHGAAIILKQHQQDLVRMRDLMVFAHPRVISFQYDWLHTHTIELLYLEF